ncbi:acetyltransferase [Halalkalibacter wakoensis JCM 9140]|uniref:Acetyltransferase n=1 Tax=Halalkalibacter wakoensis JCM 9140 TaxID=1236970 RepID=W4Q003_9BACI|nr:GNAT family N-acetyltransferase [Halalkalibacter wakoensis]GAE25275.1 acetyltransferase [Halalkalibacter wakoensis JCM 9140]
MIIRMLQKKDSEAFKELRLEGLKEEPKAFAASFEEELDKPTTYFENKLTNESIYYGLFQEEHLVGMVSLTRPSLQKMRHKASLGSFYISSEARGKGYGKKILIQVMQEAKRLGIEQLQLVVAMPNEKAKQLYESLGFYVYGFEKRALKVNGEYIDEEYMMRELENEEFYQKV